MSGYAIFCPRPVICPFPRSPSRSCARSSVTSPPRSWRRDPAEVYVGSAVVSRRHGGLAAVWVGITVLLNALILPLCLSGLQAAPVWDVLDARPIQVAWGAGLGLLSTLCVCGCLWADVVLDGSGLPEEYETHLLGRLSDEEARRSALEAEVAALRALAEGAPSGAVSGAPAPSGHAACALCGYWNANQHRVAGHVTQCKRRAARGAALASESSGADSEPER
jgi:hypothetical protein